MLCPECNHTLNPISINTVIRPVTLDYCLTCGGIWSDQGEVNFIKDENLDSLKNVLPKNPQHPIMQYQLCPRDRSSLQIFSGESVPRDLVIYRCGKCGGVWFPQGSLMDFKKAQKTKIDYFKAWKIPLSSVYAVLLPLLFIAVLGGGLVVTLIGLQKPSDNRSRAKDVISKPVAIAKSNLILISFTTARKTTAKIKYWRQEKVVNEVWVSTIENTLHTVTIKNLDPGTTYSYQIILEEPEQISSEIYNITTLKE